MPSACGANDCHNKAMVSSPYKAEVILYHFCHNARRGSVMIALLPVGVRCNRYVMGMDGGPALK